MARMRVGQRRSGLVDAGLRVMDDRGVAAATTRAIVAEADMSLASFHYAYTSREEMMGEAIRAVTEAESPVQADIPAGASAADKIEAVFGAYLDRLVDKPGHRAAMVELNQYANRLPALSELATQQYAAYRDSVKQSFAAAGLSFDDADQAARVGLAILDGVSLQWLADRDLEVGKATLKASAQALASLTSAH